jgi:hypothetical protein
MHVPSAADLLLAWERGLDKSSIGRALELLKAATGHADMDSLSTLPIGKRDAHLLNLRQLLFGKGVAAISRCPECGDQLDVAFNVDDVRLDEDYSKEMDEQEMEAGAQIYQLTVEGYDISYRVPTSADILAIAAVPSEENDPQQLLLQRCVMHIRADEEETGETVAVDALPPAAVEALSQSMAEADPQAEIELALECPGCGHGWFALFDIAAFLWDEIHAWAQRTLQDVHVLARAYGWREQDILAMSPQRRQIYLELAQS